jgi:hypothetical protein
MAINDFFKVATNTFLNHLWLLILLRRSVEAAAARTLRRRGIRFFRG